MPEVIIENLEPCLSPWLKSEYAYVAKLFNEITFTNAGILPTQDILFLKNLGKVKMKSIKDILTADEVKETIVLDPAAEIELTHGDVETSKYIVIGGIMGDHPPKKRTWEYLTSKLRGVKSRNLGKHQLTIFGAGYVLKKVWEGMKLSDIEIKLGVNVRLNLGGVEVEIELPYAFPAEGSKVVMPEGYLDIVARRSLLWETKEYCRGI